MFGGGVTGIASAVTRIIMSKILTISPEKCTSCRSCELICSFIKTGEFNPRESAVKVLTYEAAAISVPVMCMQCEEPACMKICPVNAFSRDEHGAVVLDEEKCIVCKLCISACPMGNITFSSALKKIVKCNLCDGDPYCAKVCPSGTIKYEDGSTANINKKRVIAEKFKDLFAEVKN
jgi:anaerobic carbon-monoxide dehydrogenase iron sulfur subunit